MVGDLLLGGAGGHRRRPSNCLREVPAMPVDEAFAFTGELSARLFKSDEAREGITAYLDKRSPSWAPARTMSPSKENT